MLELVLYLWCFSGSRGFLKQFCICLQVLKKLLIFFWWSFLAHFWFEYIFLLSHYSLIVLVLLWTDRFWHSSRLEFISKLKFLFILLLSYHLTNFDISYSWLLSFWGEIELLYYSDFLGGFFYERLWDFSTVRTWTWLNKLVLIIWAILYLLLLSSIRSSSDWKPL